MSADLASLAPGPVEGVFALRTKERKLSRRGRPYLELVLADAGGAVQALVLDQPDFFDERVSAGQIVRVTGRADERDGRLRIILSSIRPAPGEVDPAELVPRSHRDPDELLGFVMHLADEVADPGLRRLLAAVTGDAGLVADLVAMPCSRSGHHAYRGGLVEHTVGVASLAQTLTQWHPRIDADLLVSAALLHDIGHARAFRIGATFELTEEGRLLGHLALGDEIVAAAARTSGLPAARGLALRHAIAWHHGPPAGQLPGAASPEALALWRINALEVGVKARLEGTGPAAARPGADPALRPAPEPGL